MVDFTWMHATCGAAYRLYGGGGPTHHLAALQVQAPQQLLLLLHTVAFPTDDHAG